MESCRACLCDPCMCKGDPVRALLERLDLMIRIIGPPAKATGQEGEAWDHVVGILARLDAARAKGAAK